MLPRKNLIIFKYQYRSFITNNWSDRYVLNWLVLQRTKMKTNFWISSFLDSVLIDHLGRKCFWSSLCCCSAELKILEFIIFIWNVLRSQNLPWNKILCVHILAGPNGLPGDAHKIVVHSARQFYVYCFNNGAYKLRYNNSPLAIQILGNTGHAIGGTVTNKFIKEEYNIFLTMR